MATITICLDPYVKTEERSVKLRVIINRQARYFRTDCNLKLTQEQLDNKKLKISKTVIEQTSRCKDIAETIIKDSAHSLTLEQFKDRYMSLAFGKVPKREVKTVTEYKIRPVYDSYFDWYYYEKAVSAGTKESYETARSWVKNFAPNCYVSDFTPDFLRRLEVFIKQVHKKETGCDMSVNSIGIYMRGIRAVWHFAAEKLRETGHQMEDPFKKYQIRSAPREKKSLQDDELKKILNFQPTTLREERGKDFFMLTILLCGLNFGDIISIHNANIEGNTLRVVRNKTERYGRYIIMEMPDTAIKIIKKYGTLNPKRPSDYVFPYLNGIEDEARYIARKKNVLRSINVGLKSICSKVGITKITTYNGRHTYSNMAVMDGGLSIEHLQQFLGHTSTKTTQTYLDSITSGAKRSNREFLEKLIGG